MNNISVSMDNNRWQNRPFQSDVPALSVHPDSHKGNACVPDWESIPASQSCARKNPQGFSATRSPPPLAQNPQILRHTSILDTRPQM